MGLDNSFDGHVDRWDRDDMREDELASTTARDAGTGAASSAGASGATGDAGK
jgi:hypothetical protein